MMWKKLKVWWQKKVKKSQQNIIKNNVSGSMESKDKKSITPTKETVTIENLFENIIDKDMEKKDAVGNLMEKLLDAEWFEEELVKMSDTSNFMLMPREDGKSHFLFSPVLGIYRIVKSPVEIIKIEKSNENETLCVINNIVYSVQDKYIVDIGWN
jgi:hypothetical protein